MNKISQWVSLYGSRLFSLLIACAVLHGIALFATGQFVFWPVLVGSYLINALFTFVVIGVLYELKDTYTAQLGYLFLVGSLVKIGLFFGLLVAYKPAFLDDASFSTVESLLFFVPYGVSMIFETVFLIRFLNLNSGS